MIRLSIIFILTVFLVGTRIDRNSYRDRETHITNFDIKEYSNQCSNVCRIYTKYKYKGFSLKRGDLYKCTCEKNEGSDYWYKYPLAYPDK